MPRVVRLIHVMCRIVWCVCVCLSVCLSVWLDGYHCHLVMGVQCSTCVCVWARSCVRVFMCPKTWNSVYYGYCTIIVFVYIIIVFCVY